MQLRGKEKKMNRDGSKPDNEKEGNRMRGNELGGGRVKQGRMRQRENGTAVKATRKGELKKKNRREK